MSIKNKPIESHTGQWVDPGVSYVDPIRIACDFCGRPIPRRYWSAEVNGNLHRFCNADHEQSYVDYWLPTWGKPAPTS